MEEEFTQNKLTKRPLNIPVRNFEIKEGGEVNYRISTWMAVFLVSFAVLVDLAELFITWIGAVVVGGIISTVISTIAGFVFFVWYLLLGVPAFGNPKQLTVRMITFVGEIMPFFDAIPILSWLWTIGTILTIIISRSEDKGGVLGQTFNTLNLESQKKLP